MQAIWAIMVVFALLYGGLTTGGPGGRPNDHHNGYLLQMRSAGGSTAAAPTVVPGGPGYLMLTASDFQPDSDQDQFFRYFGKNGIEPASGSPGIGISAPVHLPQGAQINKVTVWYYDNNPNEAPLIDFYRGITDTLDLIGPLSGALPTATFAGGHDVRSVTVSGSAAVVDNSRYAYMIIVSLSRDTTNVNQTQRLSAVRVDYTYNVAMPTVMR